MTGTAGPAAPPVEPSPSGALSGAEPGAPGVAGPLPSVAVVVAAMVVLFGLAQLHGPPATFGIALLAAALAVATFSGRLTLPSNPLLRHLAVAVVGGALALVFADHVGAFTDFQIAQVAYYLPAVAGLNLLTGHNGQLSLGHGAIMAVGAYTGALLMTHQPHVAIVFFLLAAVVVSALAGLIVGIAAARLRGPYLAGATLTLAVGLPDLAIKYSRTLGGEQGLNLRPLNPPSWLSANFAPERWLAWVGIVCSLAVLVVVANVMRSGLGRRFRTVRDDETAASLVGISVARTQILAFVVSAGCAGLAGALYGLANSVANPEGFTLTLSFALLTAIVVGGIGTLAGSIWGAIALVYIPHLTNSAANRLSLGTSVKGNLPLAIYGLALVGAMLVFPEGIQGGVRRIAGAIPGLRPSGTRG
jgi:branched-chain amino acid transport system permease protein